MALTSLTRATTGTLLAFVLASACGGKSFESGGGEGGSTTGAASGQAGSKPTAGNATGGSTSAGGVGGSAPMGGTSSTGGRGGYAGEGCTAPPQPGMCNAYQPSWYHDPSTGVCRPFVYGGCGGNANRYASLKECQSACRGGTPDYDACTQPTDCVLAGTGCCGVCDAPSLTNRDFIAYNAQYQEVMQCAADIACAPCPPIAGGARKYFVPDCVQGQCTVIDLRDPQYTACMVDEECAVRYGTGCCHSCSPDDIIALRKDVNIERLVCNGNLVGCPECEPSGYPPTPVCAPEGRCSFVQAQR